MAFFNQISHVHLEAACMHRFGIYDRFFVLILSAIWHLTKRKNSTILCILPSTVKLQMRLLMQLEGVATVVYETMLSL